jgi:hypothetical protein
MEPVDPASSAAKLIAEQKNERRIGIKGTVKFYTDRDELFRLIQNVT